MEEGREGGGEEARGGGEGREKSGVEMSNLSILKPSFRISLADLSGFVTRESSRSLAGERGLLRPGIAIFDRDFVSGGL